MRFKKNQTNLWFFEAILSKKSVFVLNYHLQTGWRYK